MHVWELAERNSWRAWKKGWWIGNGGRHEPDPDVRAALVTAVIVNSCPGPDSSHSVGCAWIRWAMKKESWRSNKKIRNMILQPIYLWKDQSHHSPPLPTVSVSTALHKEFGTSKIQPFLLISSGATKIPSWMFSKQAKSKQASTLQTWSLPLTPSMALLIHVSPFSSLAAVSGDLWHLKICWSCGNSWNDIIDKLATTF